MGRWLSVLVNVSFSYNKIFVFSLGLRDSPVKSPFGERNRPAQFIKYLRFCLVPVRRFPSPSQSIRFGDVSEANGQETHFRMDHVTRNALAARKNEA